MAYRPLNGKPQLYEYLGLLIKINQTSLEKFGDPACQRAITEGSPPQGLQRCLTAGGTIHPACQLLTAQMILVLLGLENCLSPMSS